MHIAYNTLCYGPFWHPPRPCSFLFWSPQSTARPTGPQSKPCSTYVVYPQPSGFVGTTQEYLIPGATYLPYWNAVACFWMTRTLLHGSKQRPVGTCGVRIRPFIRWREARQPKDLMNSKPGMGGGGRVPPRDRSASDISYFPILERERWMDMHRHKLTFNFHASKHFSNKGELFWRMFASIFHQWWY